MASGRPPRAAVRAAVRACLADLEPGDRVVVALSGGADSLALTAAVVVVGAEIGLRCEAVVIDHQIQAGSGQVAARAAEQARILGCSDARVLSVQVPRGAGSGGVEAAARAVRYAALDAVAGVGGGAGWDATVVVDDAAGGSASPSTAVPPAAAILLGHTREDQAETVLLGLARGSGSRSLAGMAARTGIYRRPLLDLPRAVVVAAAREAAAADPQLEPWTDPHNADATFARVRVREEVLPMLEAALGPGIVEALSRTAALAREDADALDAWADQVWAQASARDEWPLAPQQCGNELPIEQQEPSELTAAIPLAGSDMAAAKGSSGGESAAGGPSTDEPSTDGPSTGGLNAGGLSTGGPSTGGPSTGGLSTGGLSAGGPGVGGLGVGGLAVGERSLVTALSSTSQPIGALPIGVQVSASNHDPGGEPLPPAIVNRVVRRFLLAAGCPRGSLTAGHIRAVSALLDPQSPATAEVALPGGRRARREAGAVVVRV